MPVEDQQDQIADVADAKKEDAEAVKKEEEKEEDIDYKANLDGAYDWYLSFQDSRIDDVKNAIAQLQILVDVHLTALDPKDYISFTKTPDFNQIINLQGRIAV